MPEDAGFHIDVSTDGDVSPRDVERAQDHLARAAGLVPDQVMHGRVRLVMQQNTSPAPARRRPARVDGELQLARGLVRARAAAPTMQEAVDRFADRLRARLTGFVGRRLARRETGSEAEPGEWRRGDIPTDRPDYFDRPAEEREIVRRKTFAVPSSTPEEAAFDMEALDHDFFLFRNAESGEANVVHRLPQGGYELIQPSGGGTDGDPGPIPTSELVPPRLSLEDAVTALNVSDQPFLFFIDTGDGEGAVLYRRYDGHYGLITLEDQA